MVGMAETREVFVEQPVFCSCFRVRIRLSRRFNHAISKGFLRRAVLMNESILDLPIQSPLQRVVFGLVVILKNCDEPLKFGIVLAKLPIVLP